MAKLDIIQLDQDSQEAVVQIIVDVDATDLQYFAPTSNEKFLLTAFWHPVPCSMEDGNMRLFAFLVSNIIRQDHIRAPVKTDSGFFSYYIFAKVFSARNRHVRCGDVDIILDRSIPGDIVDGDIIGFHTQRLDV